MKFPQPIQEGTQHTGKSPKVSWRCPVCLQFSTLDRMPGVDDAVQGQLRVGIRRCSNPVCLEAIFVELVDHGVNVHACYPSQVITFDSTNLPEGVVKSLKEALTCHAHQCFVAAAIMIRKTLEELCTHQNVTQGNLKTKIAQLANTITLPQELLAAMDELRLLGNDAAHIESRTFTEIGKTEIEVAIEFTQEILKAVYQYQHLLERLRLLKAPPK